MFYNFFNKFKNNTQYYLPITLVLILGFALRIYKISLSYVWRDEAYTWNTIQFGFENIFNTTKWDTHPPGYSYLLFFWTRVFGESAFGMRSMSLFFGMLVIYLIYRFSLKQTNSYWIASVTALLVAVNPELVIYSQEARSYTIFAAITIGLFYILSRKLNTNTTIAAILLAMCGLLIHSLFLIVVPIIYIWHWYFYGKNNIKQVSILIGTTILLYLPYTSILKQQTKDKGADFWLKFNPYTALDENIKGLFTSYFFHPDYSGTPVLINAIVYTVYIGLILAAYQEYKNNRIRLAIIPVLFLGVMYLISFISPVFYIRYIQFVIPFILLLIAIGFFRIYSSNKLIGIMMVSILTFASVALYFTDIKQTPINANYQKALNSIVTSGEKNIFNPNPDITFDIVAYNIKMNNIDLKNFVLPYPQAITKQFQTGIIKPYNYAPNFENINSMVVLTEWDNQDVKAYLHGNNFCLTKAESVDIINIDYYSVCEI
jgi:uncharacterized membrane protein